MKTKKLISLALLAAIASILMLWDFPLPFFASFLKFDFSDLPALIAAFAFGPISGAMVELVKNLVHLTQTRTGGVGELANFLVGSALVIPAGIVYMRDKNKKSAITGLLFGTLCMAVVGAVANHFILFPLYKIPRNINMILTVIVPFNLIKAVIVSLITILIYKHISHLIKK